MQLKLMILHVFLVFFISSLLSIKNGVVARNLNLTKQEDLELEMQLKRLNKPAIKTIYSEHGDIYDCVDFYKQPAFDHPRLKNHTYNFEAETAHLHNETQDQSLTDFIKKFGLKGEECPIGTVIIKRVTKEDLIRKRLVSNRKTRASNGNSVITSVVRTLFTLDTYAGASANIGIYNPPVNGNQYSSSRILIQRGLDKIEIGWRVDPTLNMDDKTHVFIRTDARESVSHCFGTDCPGFVVTSRVISVNSKFEDTVSEQGGENFTFQVDITRGPVTGNWKLRVGPGNRLDLGYWPKEIFSEDGLTNVASYVEWGAEVFSPPEHPNTIMGYGDHPTVNSKDTAFIKKISYKDPNLRQKYAEGTELYTDDNEKYKVLDLQSPDDYFGYMLFYGGPILQL